LQVKFSELEPIENRGGTTADLVFKVNTLPPACSLDPSKVVLHAKSINSSTISTQIAIWVVTHRRFCFFLGCFVPRFVHLPFRGAVFFRFLLSCAELHGASCLAQNPGKKVPGWGGGNKSDYESGAESDGQVERDRGFKTVLQAGQIKGSRR
jgi:hypothetical protein